MAASAGTKDTLSVARLWVFGKVNLLVKTSLSVPIRHLSLEVDNPPHNPQMTAFMCCCKWLIAVQGASQVVLTSVGVVDVGGQKFPPIGLPLTTTSVRTMIGSAGMTVSGEWSKSCW